MTITCKDSQDYYGALAYRSDRDYQLLLGNQARPSLSLYRELGNSKRLVPYKLLAQLTPQEMRKQAYRSKKKNEAWFDNEQYGAVNHRCLRPISLDEISSVVVTAVTLARAATIFIGVICIFSAISIMFVSSFAEGIDSLKTYLWFVVVPFIIWMLCLAYLKFIPLQHGVGSPWELNRQTGMVSQFFYNETNPQTLPKVKEVPFYELEAFILNKADRYGVTHLLTLKHRYSDFTLNVGELIGAVSNLDECDQLWYFIQNYMDTSQPLPDIPLLEDYRHLDPVTAEYDQQTGRDPHYWQNMSEAEWKLTQLNLER